MLKIKWRSWLSSDEYFKVESGDAVFGQGYWHEIKTKLKLIVIVIESVELISALFISQKQ